MKKIITLMMLLLITITVNANRIAKNGPWKAKVTVKVLDSQTLKPLPDCKVTMISLINKVHKKYIGETGNKGIYVFENKVYNLKAKFTKEGYYNSYTEILFDNSKFDFKKGSIFEPWNQEIVVKLRKKIAPTPMYVQRLIREKIPKNGKAVGYDLLIGDWLKPYGQGKVSDFVINAYYHSKKNNKSQEIYNKKLTITFSNPNDGIQKVILKKEKKTGFASRIKCQFKFIHEAPLDNYSNIFVKHDFFDGKKKVETYNRNVNYVFRIRSKTDEKGKIVSALYGKIYEDIEYGTAIRFVYYLNPTPNSRSMEWNRKNIIKKLKGKNYSVQER